MSEILSMILWAAINLIFLLVGIYTGSKFEKPLFEKTVMPEDPNDDVLAIREYLGKKNTLEIENKDYKDADEIYADNNR